MGKVSFKIIERGFYNGYIVMEDCEYAEDVAFIDLKSKLAITTEVENVLLQEVSKLDDVVNHIKEVNNDNNVCDKIEGVTLCEQGATGYIVLQDTETGSIIELRHALTDHDGNDQYLSCGTFHSEILHTEYFLEEILSTVADYDNPDIQIDGDMVTFNERENLVDSTGFNLFERVEKGWFKDVNQDKLNEYITALKESPDGYVDTDKFQDIDEELEDLMDKHMRLSVIAKEFKTPYAIMEVDGCCAVLSFKEKDASEYKPIQNGVLECTYIPSIWDLEERKKNTKVYEFKIGSTDNDKMPIYANSFKVVDRGIKINYNLITRTEAEEKKGKPDENGRYSWEIKPGQNTKLDDFILSKINNKYTRDDLVVTVDEESKRGGYIILENEVDKSTIVIVKEPVFKEALYRMYTHPEYKLDDDVITNIKNSPAESNKFFNIEDVDINSDEFIKQVVGTVTREIDVTDDTIEVHQKIKTLEYFNKHLYSGYQTQDEAINKVDKFFYDKKLALAEISREYAGKTVLLRIGKYNYLDEAHQIEQFNKDEEFGLIILSNELK